MAQRRGSYKSVQKNVSVYLGKRGEVQVELLAKICAELRCSESEFFRDLFFDKLVTMGFYDGETELPNMDKIDAFLDNRSEDSLRRGSQRIPDVLNRK